jgi:hypothetical protein
MVFLVDFFEFKTRIWNNVEIKKKVEYRPTYSPTSEANLTLKKIEIKIKTIIIVFQ